MTRVGHSHRWRMMVILPSLRIGGLERRAVKLCNTAVARGHHVRLVLGQAGGPLSSVLQPAVEVVDLGVPVNFVRRGLPRLWRAIRAFRPEVVVGLSNVGNLYGLPMARLQRVPAVFSVLGTMAGSETTNRLEVAIFRRMIALADVIFVNSQGVLESYEQAVPRLARKIQRIPNSLETSDFPVRDAEIRARKRAELGLTPDERVCITVARLTQAKDHATLLNAVAQLEAAGHRLTYVLVGGGPLRPALEQQRQDLGLRSNIHFLDDRDDVVELLQAADLFVLSSVREGMPNAVMEAMATGLAVVGTDVPGVRELVQPGRTGWAVPTRDPAALAGAIIAAIADPVARAAYGRAARARVEAEYEHERIMDRYFEVFGGVLERKTARHP